MIKLTVRDLVDLVASGASDPEARLEKMFEWSHSRNLELAKWLLALAAALMAAVAIGLLKTDANSKVSTIVLQLNLFVAGAAGFAGLIVLWRGRRIFRAHLAAQVLLGEIIKIRSFIQKYREVA